MAYGKKVYGQTKSDICAFCGNVSIKKNKIGLPVCKSHENEEGSPAFKCLCGSWLDIKYGKFGVYANCLNCGNMNMQKVFEINSGDGNSNNSNALYKIQKPSKKYYNPKKPEPYNPKKLSDSESSKAIETDPNYKRKRELECGIFFD